MAKNKYEVPEDVLEDFRNHLYYCFTCLGIGEPTPKQYAMANRIQHGHSSYEGYGSRMILQGGRRDGKSVIVAAYASWKLLKNPNRTLLVLSAGSAKAAAFVGMVRQIIELVSYMHDFKPSDRDEVGAKDNALGFNVGNRTSWNQDWSIRAVGITGQITGYHADDIIVDDIEIAENSETPMAQDKLFAKFLEIENVSNKRDDEEILVLGTPHHFASIYNKIAETFPVVKFPAVMPDITVEDEVEDVDEYILTLDLKPGQSTQPERFSDEKMKAVEIAVGPTNFQLHYRLITTLADKNRFPLKMSDLIVFDVDRDHFPQMLMWGTTEKLPYAVQGMKGDALYGPTGVTKEFVPYKSRAMFIDPSGRGADETTICIASFASGYIIIHELCAMPGGYDDLTLNRICDYINEYNVTMVHPEDNFGDGMFTKLLLAAIMARCRKGVGIEEIRATGNKEKRICDTLEPLFAAHRMVMASHPARDPENQRQITRMQRRSGALKHDDRADILAHAAAKWKDALVVTPQVLQQQAEQNERNMMVKTWLSAERGVSLLGNRVSGALVVNGKPLSDGKPKFGDRVVTQPRGRFS